jgi:hypothetical protein
MIFKKHKIQAFILYQNEVNPRSWTEYFWGSLQTDTSSFFIAVNPALIQCLTSEVSPSLLHHISIDTPSKRWTIDGLSMDYRWIIL